MTLVPDSLNKRILELGNNARTSDNAPNTWAELKAAGLNDLVVWPGASDKTIYGSAEVNIALRHWHDRIHLEHGLGFTLEDELKVAAIHIEQLHEDSHKRIIQADIEEQVRWYYQTGTYVQDQFSFIEECLS